MKRIFSIFLILCMSMSLLIGCGPKEEPEEQPPEENIEQQAESPDEETENEYATVTGEFQGLADGHSIEVLVDGEYEVYSFYDEDIAARLENMDPETKIQFDVELNGSDVPLIVKLYDVPAEG